MHARWFGLFPFRSPLLRKSNVSFSSSPYLDVSVQEVPNLTLFDSGKVDRSLSCQVSPFRNLRVNGYLLLTAAYRSLSRLSSALSAKASTLRSFLLYLIAHLKLRTIDLSLILYCKSFLDLQEVLNTFDTLSHIMDIRCLVKYIMAYIFLSV